MAIRVALHHRTQYRYDRPVTLSPHVVRLRPAPHCRTPILSYSLKVEPRPHFLNWQQDPYGNYLARLVFPEPTPRVPRRGRSGRRDDGHQPVRLLPRAVRREVSRSPTTPALARELAPYLETRAGRAALARAGRDGIARPPTRTIDFLVDLNRSVQQARSATSSAWSRACRRREETLTLGSGSCRDSAWLLVQLLRHLGLAARFVSGYLIQLVADVKPLDGPAGPGARLHRPARLGRGLPARRRLDRPRPDLRPAGRRGAHPAGLHRRPADRRADHRRVRVDEAGRGRRVRGEFDVRDDGDAHPRRRRASPSRTPTSSGRRSTRSASASTPICARGDVRLTMGGEPTFVSIDDRDGAEWNTAALGPTQAPAGRRRCCGGCATASRRAGCCTSARASGIPGEPLPRWALGCYWRKRRRADLAATRRCSPTSDRDYGHGRRDARALRRGAGRAAGRRPRARACPATRTSGTTCGASGGCRSTSIRSTSRLDDADGARAAGAGLRAGARARSSATRCRCAAAVRPASRAGRAAPGSCAASSCS